MFYSILNVADVIITHSVEKNGLIYAQLSTLVWAACGCVMKFIPPSI